MGRSSSPPTPGSAAKQLAVFLAKFEPKAARLIRACRAELRRLLPTSNELVYDNYNFFVIGYSPTERASDTLVSLAAAANGTGLSFYHGATLPDPKKLLLGEGKQNRFIRLPASALLRSPDVVALIRAAARHAKTPPAPSGRGRLIIKSVSKIQRPRRR